MLNHIYRVVFNRATGCYVAVSEIAKSSGKSSRSTTVGAIESTNTVSSDKSNSSLNSGYPLRRHAISMAIAAALGLSAMSAQAAFVCVNSGGDDGASTATGSFATACGFNNNAPGDNSSAVGFDNMSSGLNSSAVGFQNESLGWFSSAVGNGNRSFGEASSAMGCSNLSKGYNSSAMGSLNDSEGDISSAMGSFNRSLGEASSAVGYNNKSSGALSSAMGFSNESSGTRSSAMGNNTQALGEYSSASGSLAGAIADGATAVGGASGFGAIITRDGGMITAVNGIPVTATGANLGDITEINGVAVTAAQRDAFFYSVNNGGAVAFGLNSTAAGAENAAIGNRSSAMGVDNLALSDYSSAMGSSSIASAAGATAVGSGDKFRLVPVDGAVVQAAFTAATPATLTDPEGRRYKDDGAGGKIYEFAAADYKPFGIGATASAVRALALGTDAVANLRDSVALGSKSVTSVAAGVAGYDPSTQAASTNTSPTWRSTHAAISVGDTTDADPANWTTRQITGVAAGTEDTNAVNIAQFKKVQTTAGTVAGAVMYDDTATKDKVTFGGIGAITPAALTNIAAGTSALDGVNFSQIQNIPNVFGGGASFDSNGAFQGPSYTINSKNFNSVGAAFEEVDSRLTTLSGLGGVAGDSAYQVAKNNGFAGSESQWLDSLQGAKGDQGDPGIQGSKGDKGDQGLQGAEGQDGLNGQDGVKSNKGDIGLQGSKGDQGIKGDQGLQGLAGTNGIDGQDGLNGQDGVKGDQGDRGDRGDAATIDAALRLEIDDKADVTYVDSENLAQDQQISDRLKQASADQVVVNNGQSALIDRNNQRITDLGYRVNELEDKLSGGIASAIAIASMPSATNYGEGRITGGTGYYNGEAAIAVGLAGASIDGSYTYKLGGSYTNSGGGAIGGGISYRIW